MFLKSYFLFNFSKQVPRVSYQFGLYTFHTSHDSIASFRFLFVFFAPPSRVLSLPLSPLCMWVCVCVCSYSVKTEYGRKKYLFFWHWPNSLSGVISSCISFFNKHPDFVLLYIWKIISTLLFKPQNKKEWSILTQLADSRA